MISWLENDPNYPPLPLVASGPEEPLARSGEGGGKGDHAMSTPTSILPPAYRQAGIKGEDKTWQFSCFVRDQPAMTNY